MTKDWKKLIREAERQGWQVEPTRRCHYKWWAPDGKTMLVSGTTTSDRRALMNHITNMRRAGFARSSND